MPSTRVTSPAVTVANAWYGTPASWDSTSRQRSRRPNMPCVQPWDGQRAERRVDRGRGRPTADGVVRRWVGPARPAPRRTPRSVESGRGVVVVDGRDPAAAGFRRGRAVGQERGDGGRVGQMHQQGTDVIQQQRGPAHRWGGPDPPHPRQRPSHHLGPAGGVQTGGGVELVDRWTPTGTAWPGCTATGPPPVCSVAASVR